MATKGNRSSGSQINSKGVAQGVSLVDPKTGMPISVVLGADGKYRIAADVQVTTNVSDLNVQLDGTGPSGDTVALTDPVSGAKVKVNNDGTIDVNVIVDAASGDNIYVVGTEDGTQVGVRRIVKIGSDGNLRVKDDQLNTTATSIDSKLGPLGQNAKNQSISVVLATDQANDAFLQVGTENGLTTGTKRVFVNNLKSQVLAAADVVENLTWANFGQPTERITRVLYTSATFPGVTIRKTLNYTLTAGQYRLDSTVWDII